MGRLYKTSDIALGSYLKLKGFKAQVVPLKLGRAEFIFENEAQAAADEFYNGKDDFLAYASSMRSLKSQVMNMVKGENDG